MRVSAQTLQHFFRTLFTAIVAFACYYQFQSPQTYWVIFSAFLLMQIRLGKTFFQQISWLLFFGLIASCLAGLSGWIGTNYILLSIYLFITSFLCISLGLLKPNLTLPFYLINLFSILSSGIALTTNQINERVEFVLLGMTIVIILNALFWPRAKRRNFLLTEDDCLKAILKLQTAFFEIYLKRDYQDKHYLYEKKIHRLSYQIVNFIQQTREFAVTNQDKEKTQILARLYESVLAQGHLRFRIKDYATFEIIDRELKALSENKNNFSGNIAALEDLYHNTLQVVAAEPLAFLCFIKALKDFYQERMNLKNG